MEKRLEKAEELLQEHQETINKLLKEQHNGSDLLYCPTPPLKIMDFTENDFNELVKPIRDKTALSIGLFHGNVEKFKFTEENTKTIDLSFLNEKQVDTKRLVKFEQASTSNIKEWRVYIDGHRAIKAIIKDKEFFSRINQIETNIFSPSFNVEMTEYWKRQKGAPELNLAYINVNKVDFSNPVKN